MINLMTKINMVETYSPKREQMAITYKKQVNIENVFLLRLGIYTAELALKSMKIFLELCF